jgi:hypothetical protein
MFDYDYLQNETFDQNKTLFSSGIFNHIIYLFILESIPYDAESGC